MNIIAQQLASKKDTQSMLFSYLTDLKQYFKKAPLLSEDKTYARILHFAETTQRYLPDCYCLSNVVVRVVSIVRAKIDDRVENMKEIEQIQSKQKQDKNKQAPNDLQIPVLGNRLSNTQDAHSKATRPLNRDINQQFVRKQVIQTLDEVIEQLRENQERVAKELNALVEQGWKVLVIDSGISNKSVIDKIVDDKNLTVTYVSIGSKTSGLPNTLPLQQVPSKINHYNIVLMSAQSILKNGNAICPSGSLMVALSARKYHIPLMVITRGFGYTQRNMIDQHFLLAENPLKYFQRRDGEGGERQLKVHIGKRFDLIQAGLVAGIVSQFGRVGPAHVEMHFSDYYQYN